MQEIFGDLKDKVTNGIWIGVKLLCLGSLFNITSIMCKVTLNSIR